MYVFRVMTVVPVHVLYCDSGTQERSSKSPALTLLDMLLCLSKASHLFHYDLKYDEKLLSETFALLECYAP